MRVGKLNTEADLLSPDGAAISTLLIGITEPEAAGFESGLLQSGQVGVRCRYTESVRSGCYFSERNGRLMLITHAADPSGKQQDLLCSARRLIGAPAVINPGSANEISALVALLEYSTRPSGNALLPAEQRRRAEFCNAQYRPQPGHEFVVAGARMKITEIDAEGTDTVVTRAWVQFLQYE